MLGRCEKMVATASMASRTYVAILNQVRVATTNLLSFVVRKHLVNMCRSRGAGSSLTIL